MGDQIYIIGVIRENFQITSYYVPEGHLSLDKKCKSSFCDSSSTSTLIVKLPV